MKATLLKIIKPAPVESPRAQLARLIDQRTAAARSVAVAEAAVERVRKFADDAVHARRELFDARARAESAARVWAAAGCTGAAPDVSEVNTAQLRLAQAEPLAKGVAEALPGLNEALEDARIAQRALESEIHTAAINVLFAEVVAPKFAIGEEARGPFLEALQLCDAMRVMCGLYGEMHTFRNWSSGNEQARAMVRELALPKDIGDADLPSQLHQFATALCADAQAKWTNA